MKHYSRLMIYLILCLAIPAMARNETVASQPCTPAYFELERRVEIRIDAYSELSFRLLAVGCRESLGEVWPPSHELVEAEFLPELREPHPVQTLLDIKNRSEELRKRLAGRFNSGVFKREVVHDVFLFDAEFSEF